MSDPDTIVRVRTRAARDVERAVLGIAHHDRRVARARRRGHEVQPPRTQVGDVQQRDVTVGVVEDDRRRHLLAADHNADLPGAGDHVRVGHDVVRRDHEAGALDPAAALGRLPVDLERRLRRCAHMPLLGGRQGCGRRDVDDRRRRQIPEHRRESALVEEAAQLAVERAHAVGHSCSMLCARSRTRIASDASDG